MPSVSSRDTILLQESPYSETTGERSRRQRRSRFAGTVGTVTTPRSAGPGLPTEPVQVCLIHWNASDWCRSTIQSLMDNSTPVLVTVIDNSGNVGLLPAQVEVITPCSNLGFTGGANVGLRGWLAGNGRYCLVASHDLHVSSRTIEQLVLAAEAHERIGICGPDMPTNGLGRLITDHGTFEEREWVSGGCMLLRRECLEEIGGFDESFGSYREDIDLCYRARQAGWLVVRAPDAKASGLGVANQERRDIGIRVNRVRFALKHYGYRSGFRAWLPNVRALLGSLLQLRFPRARRDLLVLARGARVLLGPKPTDIARLLL